MRFLKKVSQNNLKKSGSTTLNEWKHEKKKANSFKNLLRTKKSKMVTMMMMKKMKKTGRKEAVAKI